MNREGMITIECDGDRKRILKENFPRYQESADYMHNLAIKAGPPENFIKEHFALRVVEDCK